VLTWWEQSHRAALPATQSTATEVTATLGVPADTAQASTVDNHITIDNVFGVGDLESEVLKSRGRAIPTCH
jgi:hypothetical protein